MIQIKKTEWYRCRRNPDDKDFESQVIYTFKDLNSHIDFKTEGEQDSFDILIEFLMKKTETNSWISYEVIDEELGGLFEIKGGKKWKL